MTALEVTPNSTARRRLTHGARSATLMDMPRSTAIQPVLLQLAECESPVGAITFAVKDERLCAMGFSDRWQGLQDWVERRFGAIRTERAKDPAGILSRMRAYVAGELNTLDDIEVDPGGTPFQHKVWMALRHAVPAGRILTYGELARIVGAPDASRAVGAANGANPISIVIPCHRVVGSNRSLTGYGGGLPRKQWLLRHEGVNVESPAATGKVRVAEGTLPLW